MFFFHTSEGRTREDLLSSKVLRSVHSDGFRSSFSARILVLMAQTLRWFPPLLSLIFLSSLFQYSSSARASELCVEGLSDHHPRLRDSGELESSWRKSDQILIRDLAHRIVTSSALALQAEGWRPTEGYGSEEFEWNWDGPRREGIGVYSKLNRSGSYDPRKEYEEAFAPVLIQMGYDPVDFLSNLLVEAYNHRKPTHVLDLFGSGFFVEDPSLVASITGMRLGPFPKGILPDFYAGGIPLEIFGDAIDPATWEKLDRSMRDRAIPSLDLVTMRPGGGWKYASLNTSMDQGIQALRCIIGQVLIRLSPRGQFYFSVLTPKWSGPVSQNPFLQELVHWIQDLTPYKLVLHSSVEAVRDPKFYFSSITGYGNTSLDGALVPKLLSEL